MLAPEAVAATDTASAAPRLRCVLVCDLADSTALIERLGDAQASVMLREHDRIARQALVRHHGQEIDKTDGFLALFQRPIEAVAFALDYQQQLHRLGEDNGISLRTRVGIHVGELLSWRNTPEDIVGGAKPVEVEGLAKAIAARLMSLADPGQVLLSESAYSLALRARNELDAGWNPRWQEHGRYRLHGVATPLPVFEVSAHGAAPHPPRDKIKAKRIRPWYRWPPVFAVLALGLVAAPLWYALKPSPAIAFVERDWVVLGSVRNITDRPELGEALQSAFRISLEQSRHVNVLSDLAVEETLGLMGDEVPRDAIDRSLGAEIALRRGARAVIVPTVAEIGGRLRFSAELVEPQTQTTVYVAWADGVGSETALGSVDSVVRDIRESLNEEIAAISETSQPLPDVSTDNLDALRAFARSRELTGRGLRDEARTALQQALLLDPDFHLARMSLAGAELSSGDYEGALAELERIPIDAARLSARERLYFDALRTWLTDSPEETLRRWENLGRLYPDFLAAHANLAHVAADKLNRYDLARESMSQALKPSYPLHRSSLLSLATIELGRNDIAAARQHLDAAFALSADNSYFVFADTALAEGDHAQAWTLLGQRSGAYGERSGYSRVLRRIAVALDEGRRDRALEEWRALNAASANPPDVWAELTLLLGGMLGADAASVDALVELAARMAAGDTGLQSTPLREQRHFRGLLASYLAIRRGAADQVAGHVEAIAALQADGFPLFDDLLRATRSELALARGELERAAGLASDQLSAESLGLLRLQALRVAKAREDAVAAEAAARWIVDNRARLLSEINHRMVLLPLYVQALAEARAALANDAPAVAAGGR